MVLLWHVSNRQNTNANGDKVDQKNTNGQNDNGDVQDNKKSGTDDQDGKMEEESGGVINKNEANKGKKNKAEGKTKKESTETPYDRLPKKIRRKRLAPNTSYELNGYVYNTDEYGRIVSVEGDLNIVEKSLRQRNESAQKNIGKDDGRLPDDHGGHLIGDQFGGAGGKENLVPMHKDVNNYHKGEWGQMEKRWAEVLNNNGTVKVKIDLKYSDLTGRPSSFKITEVVNGKITKFTIQNKIQ